MAACQEASTLLANRMQGRANGEARGTAEPGAVDSHAAVITPMVEVLPAEQCKAIGLQCQSFSVDCHACSTKHASAHHFHCPIKRQDGQTITIGNNKQLGCVSTNASRFWAR